MHRARSSTDRRSSRQMSLLLDDRFAKSSIPVPTVKASVDARDARAGPEPADVSSPTKSGHKIEQEMAPHKTTGTKATAEARVVETGQ